MSISRTVYLLVAILTYAPAHSAELGVVRLPTSCNDEANGHVQEGLALLHHMMYENAHKSFAAAASVQPACGIAYWGQAMTFVHPLWSDPPPAATFDKGALLAATAMAEGKKTDRERAYVEAMQAYYKEGKSNKEAPNLRAFASAWAAVHAKYPDDPDAALFYSLGQLATADQSDKTFAQQRRAGELIEKVFARFPDHPGAHHYIIHAYDYPPLAMRALDVARAYGRIAPEVPHALHMPTHIFTRIGAWEDSIAWNKRSAAAALANPVAGAVSLHYLHALDYLAYSYLQRGQDDEAGQVRATLQSLQSPVQTEMASAYAFAAIPARVALERQNWAEAAALEPRSPKSFPWASYPAVEAITHFARALGAARSGRGESARQSLASLAELRDRAAATNAYWSTQVEIQRLSAAAWLHLAERQRTEALATMRQAADLESSTEKHPVTPGEVLPARELLADMLLERREYLAARKEYAATLERSPNRFNSVYGIARSAELARDEAVATEFYRKLLDLSVSSKSETRPARLRDADRYLQSHR